MWDYEIDGESGREDPGIDSAPRELAFRNFGRAGMRWWRIAVFLLLAAMLGAMGCGSSSSSAVSLTISPTTASVITNRTQQFSGLVTGSSNTAITWSLTCETGVTAATCGQIDAAGLYTAPGTIPTIPASSSTTTPTPAPTVTIKGTAQADTTKIATATLTIVTGISITITPTSATIGTNENFAFAATVTNPGCNTTSNLTCLNVTWTLPTSSTTPNPDGSINSSTGVYTAPGTVPSPSIVIITATSVADTSVTATATVTVVTATQPTVTSVSPNATAIGGLFQDAYITGTNFISTNVVYVNHAQLASSLVTQVSSSLIRARIPDFILAAPPSSGFLLIGVSEQTGSEQACAGSDQSACEIALMNVRPGVIGPNPDSIQQGTAGVRSFNVDGGFFGTGLNPADPAVTATFNGQLRGISLPGSQTIGSTRQLTVALGGGSNSNDFSVPGLYPVVIQNTRDPSKFAVTNLAIQPNYNGGSSISLLANLSVGASPSAVAINPRTGVAVVANTGSNDISLINFAPASGPPAVIASICTFAQGLSEPCPTGTPSGPVSVAIDDVLNEAVVANSASNSIAIVDLAKPEVTTTISLQNTPGAVGVNPITNLALVAMQQQNYGVLLNLNPSVSCQDGSTGPCIAGIVSISTGTNAKVAVEPHLNWALVSPGGAGSLAIVDLSNQSTNVITAISRTTNVVTVTVQSAQNAPPILVSPGDTVQISNVTFPLCGTPPTPGCVTSQVAALAPTFDGFYTVSSVGPGPNQFSYSQTGGTETDVATQSTPQVTNTGSVFSSEPVAIKSAQINAQGIAINPETQQAVLVDPATGGLVTFFSLLDQSLSTLSLTLNNKADVGTNAVAYNPLTNTVVAVNSITDKVSVIDPTVPRRLNDSNLFQLSCSKGCGPSAVAVDPGTNLAVITNQTDNSVSILNLVSPTAAESFAITDTNPNTFVSNSTLSSGPNPAPKTITVIGSGFGAECTAPPTTSLQIRLDGVPLLSTICVAGVAGQTDRVLQATVPASKLLAPHRYALDVFNPSTSQATNAEGFTVEQSVDVSTACTVPPQPAGVAIDPVNHLVAVSLFGCDSLALIDSTTLTGSPPVFLGQKANPIGVAMLPRLKRAVVANNRTGTASIVLESGNIFQTVPTGAGPMGAAADEATGEVAIANSVANTVTVVNAGTGGTSTISTGQSPVAVGFNYVNGQVASAAAASNLLEISGGTTGSSNQSFSVQGPSSVVYDPVPTDCGSNNNGTTTNTAGCFIVSSTLTNSVDIIDPVTSAQTPFAIGINPTAIAYNYFTSTLVSTNTASRTMTVADLLALKIRAVLTLPPIVGTSTNQALTIAVSGVPQYALAVDPLTNIAVVADTANGAVLFVPLPR
jgi:DNA-binding beta-propeller fold protein YncE